MKKTHVSHIYTLRWLLQTKTKLMGGTNNNSHKQNVTLRRPTKATKKRKHVKSMLFILRFSLFALRKQVVAGAIRMGGGGGGRSIVNGYLSEFLCLCDASPL